MSDGKTAGRRGKYHHGNLRRALIDAALWLIAEEGATSFTLREVARRAGVSHTAPYRHFADKIALLAAVAEEGFRAMREYMLEAYAHAPQEPLARFQALGIAYVRFALNHPSHFRVMFGPQITDPTAYPALHEVSQRTFALLVEAIVACQTVHKVRPGDPHALALVTWAEVHGLAMLLVDQRVPITGPGHVESLARQATRTLYEGLSRQDDQSGDEP
jgi:AcrR family transcriptional regulator